MAPPSALLLLTAAAAASANTFIPFLGRGTAQPSQPPTSQPPAPPKIGWQAPRWLSRLSHVHGSPFTAGSVTFGARHDADDALRARRSSQLGGGRPSIEAVKHTSYKVEYLVE